MKKVTIGIIGCGVISPAYLKNISTHFQGILDVHTCADLFPDLARQRAQKAAQTEWIVAQ